MDNPLIYIPYNEKMQGSLLLRKQLRYIYHTMKECQVANFHGKLFDSNGTHPSDVR